jgi:hypothetical protein
MARYVTDGAGIPRLVKSLSMPMEPGPAPPSMPRIVLSEHSPGPGWVALGPASRGSAAVKTSMEAFLGRSLVEQAAALQASEGLSYRDALREASRRDPGAYARWRAQIRPGVR